MPEPERRPAVFLSYASQDVAAAQRLADALRAAGIEVWFDLNELRGGDAWDTKIRRQIKECALFLPVISMHTQARLEGYFRREWRLAVERMHDMDDDMPFLVPIVIDDTPDTVARVPERFRERQWTRLPGGEAGHAFVNRVVALLQHGREESPSAVTHHHGTGPKSTADAASPRNRRRLGWPIGVAVVLGLGVMLWWQRGGGTGSPPPADSTRAPVEPTPAQRMIEQMWAIYDKVDDATYDEWLLAEDLGAQAVKLEPLNADAWAALSAVTLTSWILGLDADMERGRRALGFAERAVSLDRTSTNAQLALANCYRQQGPTRAEAETIVRELAEREPANRRVLRMAGNVMRASRKFEESMAYFDQAIALPGSDPIALISKEYTLRMAGRFAEAEAALDQSMSLHAGPAATMRKLFYVVFVYDDLDAAAGMIKSVPGSFLRRDEAALHAALVWLWRGDYSECVATLKRADREAVFAVPTGLLVGKAFAAEGRLEAARLEWRTAVQKLDNQPGSQPDLERAVRWKCYLLALLGEQSEAEEALRLYEQMTARRGGYLEAELYAALGRTEEALALLEAGARANRAANVDLMWPAFVRHDPVFDPLRPTPRFQAVLAALEEEKQAAVAARAQRK